MEYKVKATVLEATQGSGSATVSPSVDVIGNPVTYTATPSTGYQFTRWEYAAENGAAVSLVEGYNAQSNPIKIKLPQGNLVARPFFSVSSYTAYTGVYSGNGTAYLDGNVQQKTYQYNSTVTYTAEPASGYSFVKWVQSDGSTWNHPYQYNRTFQI